MYSAKEKGKNQFVLCSMNMKDETQEKIMITNYLYRALERNEFLIHYQPQVNSITKEIIGVEALLRWNNPELGMISPAVFIPLAEQTGLINAIGEWVLRTACEKNKMWQDMGLPLIRIAVNVSVNQFRNMGFSNQVGRILIETGLESRPVIATLSVISNSKYLDSKPVSIKILPT